MTYNYFIKTYILPYLHKNDKPWNRMLFSQALDAAHRAGKITDEQAQNWIYPSTRWFK